MSMSKLLITLGLILLMTTPLTIAHAADQPYTAVQAPLSSPTAGAMSDRVTISLSGMMALEKDMAYEGWLVDSTSGDKISVGILSATFGDINHTWTSPDGANILAMYDCVVISVESMPDDDPAEWADIAFMDTIDEGAIEEIRGLVVGDSSTLYMLQAQVHMAMAKIAEAQAAGDIDAVKAATEEAVGMVDGDGGIVALAANPPVHRRWQPWMPRAGKASICMPRRLWRPATMFLTWAMAAKEDAAAVTAQEDVEVLPRPC